MVDFYGAPKVFRWVFLLLHKIQLFVFAVLGVKIRFFFQQKKEQLKENLHLGDSSRDLFDPLVV